MNRSYSAFSDGPLDSPLLEFMGHSSFMLTTPGRVRLVIDPFQNPRGRARWFVRRFPPLQANIVAISHDHFDHNAARVVRGIPTVLKRQSAVKVNDIEVRLIPEQHSRALHRKSESNATEMVNNIIVVESHGVRICHLGDNRADISGEAAEAIGRVDVLAVPVDDSLHLLKFDEVAGLIQLLDPRVVVPMHYFQPGVSAPGLGTIEKWLAPQAGVKLAGSSSATLDSATLPRQREVWVMEPALATTPGG